MSNKCGVKKHSEPFSTLRSTHFRLCNINKDGCFSRCLSPKRNVAWEEPWLDLLLQSASEVTSEFFFSVLSPGRPSPAVAQKPSSPFCTEQTHQSSHVRQPNESIPPETDQPMKEQTGFCKTTHKEVELFESSVVPLALSQTKNSDSKASETHTNTSISKKHTNTNIDARLHKTSETSSETEKKISVHKEDSGANVPNRLSKDQQLQQEERILLAKIRLLSGDTSPVSSSHCMKRLIPAPGDLEHEATEIKSCSDVPEDSDRSRLRPDALQEILLNDPEELLERDKE